MIRSEAHKAFVRSLPCAARNEHCAGPIEAAHVRMGSDGGMGMKPGDDNIVPLCRGHHETQHRQGEYPFWLDHPCKGRPHPLASGLWLSSGDTRTCTKAVNRFAATGEV